MAGFAQPSAVSRAAGPQKGETGMPKLDGTMAMVTGAGAAGATARPRLS